MGDEITIILCSLFSGEDDGVGKRPAGAQNVAAIVEESGGAADVQVESAGSPQSFEDVSELLHVDPIGGNYQNGVGIADADACFSADRALFVGQAGLVIVDLDIAAVYQTGVVDDAGGETAAETGRVVEVMGAGAVGVDDSPAIRPTQFIVLSPLGETGDVDGEVERVFFAGAFEVSAGTEISGVDAGKAAVSGDIIFESQGGAVVGTVGVGSGIGNHFGRGKIHDENGGTKIAFVGANSN